MKILKTISIWNELMADKRTRNVKEYEHKVEGKDLWPIRSLLLSVCWVNDTSCRYPTIPLELRDPAFHEQPAEITNPYPLYFCPKESVQHRQSMQQGSRSSTGTVQGGATLLHTNSKLRTHRSPENSQDSVSWRFHKQNRASEVSSTSITKQKCQK